MRALSWGVQTNDEGGTRELVGDKGGMSGAELLELNRDLTSSRAIRLLAATNLGLYATLMERHLSEGAVPEIQLVVWLERDLNQFAQADGQSGLALIKSWASQGCPCAPRATATVSSTR